MVAKAIERFNVPPAPVKPQDFVREAEVTGYLGGFLTSAIPGVVVDFEPRFGEGVVVRPDLLVEMGEQRVLLEIKRGPQHGRVLQQRYLAQMAHYIGASGIKQAIIYIHAEDPHHRVIRKDHILPGVGARIVVLSRD